MYILAIKPLMNINLMSSAGECKEDLSNDHVCSLATWHISSYWCGDQILIRHGQYK